MADKKKATKALKKAPGQKAIKKPGKVRCSFKIDEAKLRRFHAKLKRSNHDLDELFAAFVQAYENRTIAGAKLGLVITVKSKKKKA